MLLRNVSEKKIFIVSWNGKNDQGGVERVTQYMEQALSNDYNVEIIDFEMIKKESIWGKLLGKFHYTLDALIVSLFTYKRLRRNSLRGGG